MDIDKYMEQVKLEEERQREKELQLFSNKVRFTDNETLYHAYLLLICERFNLLFDYNIPHVAYLLLDYYIANVSESFMKWLYNTQGPFVRKGDEIKRIFHEIPYENLSDLIDSVNVLYNLDLHISDEYDCCEGYGENYVYSFSFDFNSFTPINVKEIRELKNEIAVLEKYGYNVSSLEDKIQSYGLSEEQLDKI